MTETVIVSHYNSLKSKQKWENYYVSSVYHQQKFQPNQQENPKSDRLQ